MNTTKPTPAAPPMRRTTAAATKFQRALYTVIRAVLYHRRFRELLDLGVPDQVAARRASSYASRAARRECARRVAQRAQQDAAQHSEVAA